MAGRWAEVPQSGPVPGNFVRIRISSCFARISEHWHNGSQNWRARYFLFSIRNASRGVEIEKAFFSPHLINAVYLYVESAAKAAGH
jgi:hypothetical protein